ncbi:MAG TPA: DUF4147 domain-containing protein [Polyangia bacterium]|jgi:hydroxypyruvate reductase|nr:DUF4147 domain-containing protein [Polyangia bacterium]
MAGDVDLRGLLIQVFLDVAARIDGQRLVAQAADRDPAFGAATRALVVGKVALPMWRGWRESLPPGVAPPPTLLIAPAPLLADAAWGPRGAPPGLQLAPADHPHPSARSVAAAQAALQFVRASDTGADADTGGGTGRGGGSAGLLVLLSGGASSLLCAPAPGLTWEDKREAIAAVARGGATIRELNVVRKHLSAVKGGGLGRATRAPIAVRALSDVIGDDPATIGSGPFSPDPSTFDQARALVARLGVTLPAAVSDHLARGARGAIPDTAKPGARELEHVDYRVLAGPARVIAEAQAAVTSAGHPHGELAPDAEDTVEERAQAILACVHRSLPPGNPGTARPRIWLGNGEPRVILPPATQVPETSRRGGRATHLALLVARGLAGLPAELRARVAFLAAGTDDRDGNTDVSGAAVDGTTWARARAAGLDPETALRSFESLPALVAAGATVRGPGTSNLLDLHLLAIG